MRERSIEKLVDNTIGSFDAAKRAEPKPFLFTRVMAAINNQSSMQNTWTRCAAFISKPGIAISGLLLIMLVNITIVLISKNNNEKPGFVQNSINNKDEFAINAGAIYDIENPE